MTPAWLRELPPLWAWAGIGQHQLQYRFGLKPKPQIVSDTALNGWLETSQPLPIAAHAAVFQQHFPDLTPALLQKCAAILNNKLDILGHSSLPLPTPFSWTTDYKTGFDWATNKPATAGSDIKRPWELARCHHWVTLGQGYALTQDPRYKTAFETQLQHWLTENPVATGIHWKNPMEAAIRSANWIVALSLFGGLRTLPTDLQRQASRTLVAHANFIYQHLELAWPRTNHLLADACGLIWLGAYFAPLPAANAWLTRGLHVLAGDLAKQILPDGCAYEGSTSYHVLDSEMLIQTLWVMQQYSLTLPSTLVDTAKKMLHACRQLLLPDGQLPVFGDSDSGRWLALEADREMLPTRQDPLGVLAQGQALLELAAPPMPLARQQAAVWLFGHTVQPAAAAGQSAALPDAKWAILTRPETPLLTVALTAGNTGTAGWGGHGHNDALSFTLCIGQTRLLVDSGTGNYTGDPSLRNQQRKTAAHNTVQFDAYELNRLPAQLFRLHADLKITQFETSAHAATVSIQTDYWQHTRHWQLQADSTLCITDTLKKTAAFQADTINVHFHFAPGPVNPTTDGVYSARAGYPNLQIQALQPVTKGIALTDTLHTPAYDVGTPNIRATFQYAAQDQVRLQHVLQPARNTS